MGRGDSRPLLVAFTHTNLTPSPFNPPTPLSTQHRPPTPRFAPYIAAGFFFTGGSFLHDVPFDPFVPWIFMGEEIMLSAR